MASELGDIRRSQVIHNFGPGAIVDMRIPGGTVSGIHLGLEEWVKSVYEVSPELEQQNIFLKRLKPLTGRTEFRLPPVPKEAETWQTRTRQPALTLRTFPAWMQCPSCSRLRNLANWEVAEPGKPGHCCPDCSSEKRKKLVFPARFIVACKDGHIDDFPWDWHVGHKSDTCPSGSSLKLESVGPGLAGLFLSCTSCGARKSMDGIFGKGSLAGLSCRGNRPWLLSGNEICGIRGDTEDFRVLQRAGSNVYYPNLVTALDIPPGSNFDGKLLGQYAKQFADVLPEQRLLWLESFAPQKLREHINKYYSGSFEELVSEYNAEENLEMTENLRLQEFSAFDTQVMYRDPEFWTKPNSVSTTFSPLVKRVTQVMKLREVRVLTGFTRIFPPSDAKAGRVAPISSEDFDWLPAIEVRGEGIFLQFKEEAVEEWESRPQVKARLANLVSSFASRGAGSGFSPSPRGVLMHTLAHLLIKELTLESGYASASLRERLFFDETNVRPGFLIYTGTPDSEGTLGGLQVQGDPSKFEKLLSGAIENSTWCSSDPLCLDGHLASSDFYSIASCHSCTMVPETSCEFNNMFLDRGLINGSLADESIGFFRTLRI
jgi:hypothetical protein